jgi:hypothetical protein
MVLLTSLLRLDKKTLRISCGDAELLAEEIKYSINEAKDHGLIQPIFIFDIKSGKKPLFEIQVSPHNADKDW